MVSALWLKALFIAVAVHVSSSAPSGSGNFRVEFGSAVSLESSGQQIWHIEEDLFIPGNLLFSWGSSLHTTSGSSNATRLAGSVDEKGYKEGKPLQALFNNVVFFKQLGPNAVFISDKDNFCIRTLQRQSGDGSDVTPAFGKCGQKGNTDGDRGLFSSPGSFVWDTLNGFHLIVADEFNDALRRVEYNKRLITTIVPRGAGLSRPRYLLKDPQDVNYVYITMPFSVARFHLPSSTLTVLTGSLQTTTSDGPFPRATFGSMIPEVSSINNVLMVASDLSSNRVRLLDLQNKQSYTVCPNGSVVQLKSSSAAALCNFQKPHALLYSKGHLYVGGIGRISKIPVSLYPVTDPKHLVFTPSTTASTTKATTPTTTPTTTTTTTTTAQPPPRSTIAPCISENLTITLDQADTVAEVAVTSEDKLLLGEGEHIFVSKKNGGQCMKRIKVKKPAIPCPTNTNINRVADPRTGSATVDLTIGDVQQRLELPIGTHPYFIKSDGTECFLNINVYDGNVQRVLAFQAEYDFSCDYLKDAATKAGVESLVKHNSLYIQEVCSTACVLDSGYEPLIQCKFDILTVQYLTDTVFNGAGSSISRRLQSDLNQRLVKKGAMMSIVVLQGPPRVAFPRKTADDAYAKLILIDQCSNGLSFDSRTQRCK